MNKNAKRILKAAQDFASNEVEGLENAGQAIMLGAIAVMLDAAVKQPKVTRKKKDAVVLPFTLEVFYETLKDECSGHLNIDTYTGSSFGRLGKTLKAISPPIEEKDLDLLVSWIQSGGVDFWNEPPTWNHLIRNIVTWIAKAREYEYRGEGGGPSVVR